MRNNIIVTPWFLDKSAADKYDIFICSLGYEARARFIAEKLDPRATHRIASAFVDNMDHSYRHNEALYKKIGYEINYQSDDQFNEWCKKELHSIIMSCDKKVIKIIIDISSMTRHRIASLVASFSFIKLSTIIDVTFAYSPAKFSKPAATTGPIIKSGPVMREYAGWSSNPDLPSATIIGLGYNYDKAVGAVEYIEPGELWLMNPIGGEPDYEKTIRKANESLLAWFSKKERVISYNVIRTFDLYNTLKSLTIGALRFTRPIIIPFGPKTFTLCSLLVASELHPQVSVWRISSDKFEESANRIPDGSIIGISAQFMSELPN